MDELLVADPELEEMDVVVEGTVTESADEVLVLVFVSSCVRLLVEAELLLDVCITGVISTLTDSGLILNPSSTGISILRVVR